MRLRPLLTPLKWAAALLLLAGLAFAAYLVHGLADAERAREGDRDRVASKSRVKDGVLDIGEENVERYGLETSKARAEQWQERVPVYGRVVPNPQATAEVRVPFAGTLRAASSRSWPGPGRRVKAGQILGWVDVRVGPDMRLDLRNKLSEARIKQQGAEEEVKLHQSRADSLKAVTSKAILARGELDVALVQLAQARTQLASARAAAELWQKALEEVGRRGTDSPWSEPLRAPAEGEVTELAGRPGTAIEAGGLVAQIIDFRRPLVRLDVPPELLASGVPSRVQLVATAAAPPAKSSATVEATLVGPTPRLDVASQFAGFWYDVKLPPLPIFAAWRPGLQVKAFLPLAGGKSQPAVSVPEAAVLYHEGRTLVYVQVGSDKFQKREVTLLGREGDRWVLAGRRGTEPAGVAPGEAVVWRQAQILLSEEFRGVGTLIEAPSR